jgi:hypothetical protein
MDNHALASYKPLRSARTYVCFKKISNEYFQQIKSYSNINKAVYFGVCEVLKTPSFSAAFKSPTSVSVRKQIFYDPMETVVKREN